MYRNDDSWTYSQKGTCGYLVPFHNPSSTTSQDAFHGTRISLFQNRVAASDGIMRHNTELRVQAGIQKKEIPPLPESYTILTHAAVINK